MKIGIVIDRLNVGGVEKIAIEQVRALRGIDEDAYLVVLREKGVVKNAFPDLVKTVPIIYLDQRLPSVFRFSFQFPVFHFFSSFHLTYPIFLPFVIKKNEFDYFIVHGTYTCLSAISIRKIRGIRFSAFIWDPVSYILIRVYEKKFSYPVFFVLKKIAFFLDNLILRNIDEILVGGTAHNKLLKEINPRKKIRIIYPSVHPIKKQTVKKNFILMITAWKEGKDPEYIAEITKKISEFKIIMAGKWLDNGYKKKFELFLKDKKLNKQIELTGEVSESRLSQLYSSALLLLQTNDDRGFGMPALEAAGHGTTFIIPKGQGVCKLFTAGKEGFYTNEKDTNNITELINELIKNKKKVKLMGKNALEKIKNNYSWEKHALLLKKVIEENYNKL